DVDAAELARSFWDAAFAGEDRPVEIELDVARDEEIEKAIAIIVAPGGAGGPSAESDAGFFGDVCESAVVVVVVEAIFPVVGDINVRPAVVVVVGDGNSKTPALVGDAGFFGHVREGAIVIVVEKHGTRRRFF